MLFRSGGKGGNDAQVVTDFVSYGAITSTVEGSGLTKAKNSETITLTTGGTVQDVIPAYALAVYHVPAVIPRKASAGNHKSLHHRDSTAERLSKCKLFYPDI